MSIGEFYIINEILVLLLYGFSKRRSGLQLCNNCKGIFIIVSCCIYDIHQSWYNDCSKSKCDIVDIFSLMHNCIWDWNVISADHKHSGHNDVITLRFLWCHTWISLCSFRRLRLRRNNRKAGGTGGTGRRETSTTVWGTLCVRERAPVYRDSI